MNKKIVIAAVCIALSGVILVSSVVIAITSAIEEVTNNSNDNYTNISIDGLPPFITSEMLGAIIEEQQNTGYPASVALAQIILESGFGRYGPGGEQSQGLSRLAYDYKNLFGMKAPAGNDIPIGVVNMQTGEEVNGIDKTIVAGFLVFRNYKDCIQYRSTLITSVYLDLVEGVTDPDTFACKLASRWATSSSYGNALVRHMQHYNLYKYNSLTLADLNSENAIINDGTASFGQRKIAEYAMSLSNFGCGQGWCQKWVATVYQKAGQNPFQTRACATEAANSFLVSGSRKNIPIGATVYGSHSYGGVMCGSHDAGHVGIYVGNGRIVSNEGAITVKTVEQWTATYGWRGWGWNGNEDFSRR